VWYCGAGCQRKDWPEHEVSERIIERNITTPTLRLKSKELI
jgi:hypothetical protein